ncbi:MAG TPA: type I methionyl aminopeptidase [Chloroflexota bacterium]|nr:type I methionyl aminopeptidase [Chloroflexota bacterium]
MIVVKSRAEVEKMRRANRIVADALDAVSATVRPGVTTLELDAIAEDVIRGAGAEPSFKGYSQDPERQPPFPGTICASINEELVHGIPGKRVLRDGDVLSIDVGAYVDGFHGDAAITVPVGTISAQARRLLDVTQESLFAGIAAARGGNRLGDVSHAIGRVILAGGYSVVQGYGGHGVGRRLHEDPHVSNSGTPGKGPLLQPGMTVALEPMANLGRPGTTVRPDRWTVVTADRKLCAHFEHTICVTTGAPEILTEFSPAVYQRVGGPIRGPLTGTLAELVTAAG